MCAAFNSHFDIVKVTSMSQRLLSLNSLWFDLKHKYILFMMVHMLELKYRFRYHYIS